MASVGTFSVSENYDIDFSILPASLRKFFKFDEIDRQKVGGELPVSNSLVVVVSGQNRQPKTYRKFFVCNIRKKDFALALHLLFPSEDQTEEARRLYPQTGSEGFLGARFTGDMSVRQFANAVTRVCSGRCPCRQYGCVCNQELQSCV